MKDKGGIYIIENKVDGKKYIGQTIGFKKRFKHHRISLRGNKHRNPHLQHAWNKYGEDNFKFIEFFPCEREKFGYWELYFVRMFNSLDQKKGYNIHIPDGKGRGFTISEETRKRMGDASRGKNNANYGKVMSQEQRKKISDTLKGGKLSPETIAKISGKNNHNYGRTGAKHPLFGKSPSLERRINASRAWGVTPFAAYKDGSKIGEYDTQAQCGRELGIRQSGVSGCLSGRYKSSKGYTFVYLIN